MLNNNSINKHFNDWRKDASMTISINSCASYCVHNGIRQQRVCIV